MMFLDVIATPFYLLYGVGFLLLMFGIASLVVLTMIIIALFQGSSKKKDEDNDNKKEPQP